MENKLIPRKYLVIPLLLLLLPLTSAQTLYQQDSLLLQLKVNSGFDLKATNAGATLERAAADLLLFPNNDFRQKIVNLDSNGVPQEKNTLFEWNDGRIEQKNYGYTALIETNNRQLEVKTKIAYPLTDQQVQGLENYLLPTKTIDSDNSKIISKATELAEGEDDLFKVVFKLASWVEENVNYDLNTLTETAALPASWVLENREGVCDEMTSLFVAMARSLGIPARFVSGISYSTSPLFAEPWQPHGWAEVYFPEIGWVSFDITFGEYGYIDVTHLRLRDGFDPAEPATKFEWLGRDVELKAKPLDLTVSVIKNGIFVPEKIQLEQEILAEEVGLGSYNLIKGILKNTEDYYAASTLMLAVPKETEVFGRNKRTILLSPKEVRETYWIVKTPPNLPPNYLYTYPVMIYSEKNITVAGSFQTRDGKTAYTKEDMEKLTIADEEKTYSRKVTFDCKYLSELKLGEEEKITCSVRNRGTINLVDLKFCLGDVCDNFDLPINQEKKSEILIKSDKAGQKKIVITAENAEVEKKSVLEYIVMDRPVLSLLIDAPAELVYGKPATLKIISKKDSFSIPQKVRITLKSAWLAQEWSIEQLPQTVELPLQLDNYPVMSKNKLKFIAAWQDNQGKSFSLEKEVIIPGKAKTLGDRIKMFFNQVLYFFKA